ncbi:MAG: hypothetical protein AAFX76_04200 [Planctomycetota bacterium]
MKKQFAFVVVAAAGLALSGAASAVTIDLTGSGGTFDFDAVSGTAPTGLFPGADLTITAGSTSGQGVVNATGTSLGVNDLATSGDSTDDLEEGLGETLTFEFNFDGTLTGIDLTGVSDPERLTIQNLDTGDSVELVDSGSPLSGTQLGGGDAITTLNLSFSSGDDLLFFLSGTAPGGSLLGLQTITVVPTPATGATLALIGLSLLRRRHA